MNKPAHIESFLDGIAPTLLVVDEVLNEWNGEGCLQFPTLLGLISIKLNWNEKQTRANDPIIREFVRNHPNWYVTRGAHGGIMRSSERQKKLDAEVAKKKAKEEINAMLETRAALNNAVVSTGSVDSEEDNTNSDEIISE